MALNKAERREAADMIQGLLDMVDDGDLAADGPKGVALVRRMEGAMLAVRAMDDQPEQSKPTTTEPLRRSQSRVP